MPLVLIGVNHKTCPLEIREKFFLQPVEKQCLLAEFMSEPSVLASIIISTCNRTEIYADLLEADVSRLLELFLAFKGLAPAADFEKFFYIHYEKDVVLHLFRVVAGLDSMILGEKQILGRFYRFSAMFSVAGNVLLFPAMLFSLWNIRFGWGKWHRGWRNNLVRFGGWILLRRWLSLYRHGSFAGKLAQAKQSLPSP